MSTPLLSGGEHLAVLAAGLGAGVLTSTVGVASLLSFPVLLAVGIPPVVANASNTIGLTPAGLSGSFGYRRELREQPRLALVVLVLCAAGSVGGAALLLALPPGVFSAVVPFLVLATSVLVGVQPWISRRVRARRGDDTADRLRMSPATRLGTLVTGVYGGYFGAGSGVMMMAVLGFGTDLELRVINAVKTLSVMAANVVATVIFLFLADLDWTAVGLLATGSVVGGYLGSHLGRRMPDTLLRALVVVVGTTASILLFLR